MHAPSKPASPSQQASQAGSATMPVRGALASLSLAMLLPALGTSIANVGLPDMARALQAPFQDVQWIVLAYLLAITALIVSVGRLGDMVGRRRLLLAGIALFAMASILCALAPTLWLLVAARALQGLGASVMMALTMAMVGSTVPKARTGGAMGLLGTMSAVGTTLGPALGGLLIARFGWQAIFLINVPLAGLALLLAWRYLPADQRDAHAKRPVFDHRGTALLALTLGAYALAMTLGRGHFGVRNAALLLAACVGAILFVRVELKAPAPLIRLAMLRAPALGAGLATSMLVATVMMSTLVVGPFYLARGLGLGTAVTGMVLAAGPLVAAFCGVPSGWLVDRYGAQRMGGAGLCGAAGACLALALLPASLGIPGYVAPIMLLTASYALFQAANNTAVMGDIVADQRGVISGMLNLSRNLGLVTGASVMGAVFAAGAGDIASARPAAMVGGMHATFGVASALILAALVIFVLGRTLSKTGDPT
ncbi:MFS transporter [Janthinobacterium kumbetense]|uniref:MFS transporter n=1 Tax=Janthinobacterium kumbetense TaxID=2950280 RepID=A0ABT0WJF5_9BURK|nr:MFS transporter [Janthinobacterium kumbetense]MCM2564195.1 MFS transporter [Janthinobacterium kumbetense]